MANYVEKRITAAPPTISLRPILSTYSSATNDFITDWPTPRADAEQPEESSLRSIKARKVRRVDFTALLKTNCYQVSQRISHRSRFLMQNWTTIRIHCNNTPTDVCTKGQYSTCQRQDGILVPHASDTNFFHLEFNTRKAFQHGF